MTTSFIGWIWHVGGTVALAPGQSSDDAFDKLDPLFREPGTTRERAGDTLTFKKKNQLAQDKMSIFDGGVLQVESGAAGAVLRYRLSSRALLFCFLAPLLFVGFVQLTILQSQFSKKPDAVKKAAAKKAEVPMNPIDKFLGAPAPEKPGKKDAEKPGKRGKKPSPTPAYVFAGIFATLYLVGRLLEDRLIKGLFKKRLAGA